jgi:4-carboxymuconolactone decarboxylase
MEAVYHTSPYVGFATAYEAVSAVTEAFEDNGIELPLPSQKGVSDSGRFEGGAAAQNEIFGMNPQLGEGNTIGEYVTAWCFGDFYTRDALDLKTRELLTMVTLANMEISQFSAHVMGAYGMGWSKDEILAAVTVCMPYMGTPRTLNAVATVNQVLSGDREDQGGANGPGLPPDNQEQPSGSAD